MYSVQTCVLNLLVWLGMYLSAVQAFGQLPTPVTFKGEELKSGSDTKLYQLSGIIMGKQDGKPLAYARLTVNKRLRYAVANEDGFFSIPVALTDTVYISRVGYKNGLISVPQVLYSYKGDTTSPYLYTIYSLEEDPAMLPGVTIYPYHTEAELKEAIRSQSYTWLNPMNIAGGNVSPELMAYFTQNLPKDQKDRLSIARERYENLYLLGSAAPKIDFVTVANLLKHIRQKNQSEQNKKLQSWEGIQPERE